MARRLVLGIDYGTDSARALVVDADSGLEVAAAVAPYRRWARGDYCDPATNRFRQHPRDYLEALFECVAGALSQAGAGAAGEVAGIGIDTTGSTPVAVDAQGTALAMHDRFADNPAAMFVLWKDHTAIVEAARINQLAHSGRCVDVTRYVGGIYSSEWYWAKALHILNEDAAVAAATAGWVEHCDWLPGVLTGTSAPAVLARSRCAAGHKAMWHAAWGGLPPVDFLAALDARLPALRAAYAPTTRTSDQPAGTLTTEWAVRLGLRPGITVAVGAFDAHLGAVGAGAGAYVLTKVMGTSTCDMMVAPEHAITGTVRGICGQVDGSIIPGLIGLEAGQSAFGDVYAWFRRLLGWPLAALGLSSDEAIARLLPALEAAALPLPPAGGVLALDWFNGRRTPDADLRLQGALCGLTLGTDAPALYRALVEGTAYGARAIVDRFVEQGIPVERVISLGGIAARSPLVMQVCADVLERPIGVVASEQCCALGAAIAAAVAAGIHPSMAAAQARMASRIGRTYQPTAAHAQAYQEGYRAYRALGAHIESRAGAGPTG
jgi:L-ribulokinase